MLATSACRTVVVATEPYYCEPFFHSDARIYEYGAMAKAGAVPSVRAWIREADRVCQANNALRGEGLEQ